MHSEPAGAAGLTCEMCRCQFPVKRGWQRFCTPACRNAWHATMKPEAMRKDIDALRAALAEIKATNEAMNQRIDELEAAASRCGA